MQHFIGALILICFFNKPPVLHHLGYIFFHPGLFTTLRQTFHRVFTMGDNGSNQVPFTNENTDTQGSDFAPDGTKVVYSSDLDIEVVLGGVSLGGWIAAEFAVRWPERVKALWLSNAPGLWVEEQPLPDTGTLRGDLLSALHAWVRAVTQTPMGPMLTGLIAEAQHDPELRGAWRDRVLEPLREQHRVMLDRAIARGEIAASVDRDVVLDLFFGAAEHRLLLGHLPMTGEFIAEVVDVILAGLPRPGS